MVRLKFPWLVPALFSHNTVGPGFSQLWPLPIVSHDLCLYCQRCGRRLGLAANHSGTEIATLGQEHGFLVLGSRRLIVGLCARCRALPA